jgi:hypothetical protein
MIGHWGLSEPRDGISRGESPYGSKGLLLGQTYERDFVARHTGSAEFASIRESDVDGAVISRESDFSHEVGRESIFYQYLIKLQGFPSYFVALLHRTPLEEGYGGVEQDREECPPLPINGLRLIAGIILLVGSTLANFYRFGHTDGSRKWDLLMLASSAGIVTAFCIILSVASCLL